ncbi:amino acid aminotransferase [Reinekea sp. G2M2-21]|uniref:amino acid aminotransferase n=1 Tax=Reinekea sp. G2M2-21 TaxID=2788942 RepID=UPI0018A99600|nr:amino acid aminotransferase [Reinekea sp. G2M2-21]MDX1343200.1 amino acid aminotransferase [Reinekea sp.]
MFERVERAPADPILGLNEAFNADNRPNKVNLGVGVFKNEAGVTPILDTVKEAERRLLNDESTKSYLSISGDVEYGNQVQALLFGAEHDIITNHLARTAQTPGGTGALRIASEFMARQLGVENIWVSNPTWANHGAVFHSANMGVKPYRYYNAETQSLDFDGMLEDLQKANSSEAVLLHGCCHNPTGIDPTPEQWQQLADLATEKGFVVLFDFAYQGFARGVEEDAEGLRIFAKQVPELLIASSFSKNFGLYNERVGAFTLVATDRTVADDAFSQVKTVIRANYSNPPAHGAKVVSVILSDAELRAKWIQEVADMRSHIHTLRKQFVAKLAELGVERDFSFIESQNGMFSFSGLTPDQVARLKEEYGIFIVGSGRINVAGLSSSNMEYVCKAIASVL